MPSPHKRRIRAKLPYPLDVQDPAQLFDLICVRNFMMGDLGGKIPVEESRQAYEEIKRLILYYESTAKKEKN